MTTSPATGSGAFLQKRRVLWGDTDAAGTLYFAHISRYCMEAIELWFVDRLGVDWFELSIDRQIGTPFVHAEVQFLSPATPRDTLIVSVTVESVGNSSAVFRVIAASDGEARQYWTGTFKCVFIDASTMRAIPIPQEYRAAFCSQQTLDVAAE